MKIPFDQLEVFHKDEYHQYIDETLIVSTLVYEYLSGKERNSNFILTKRNIYILKGAQPYVQVPTKILLRIIRSKHHPELVIQFAEKEKSIRISTTTMDRCQLIVEGLSYVSNMFYQRPLLCFTLQIPSLQEFTGESITGMMKNNQQSSAHKLLRDTAIIEPLYYVERQLTRQSSQQQNSQKITFMVSDKYRVCLKKVAFKQKLTQIDGYSLFLCKLNQQVLVCRIYQKALYKIDQISQYTQLQNCQSLVLVISTKHKYFLFFEYIQIIPIVSEKYLKMLVKFLINSDSKNHIVRKRNLVLGCHGPIWKQSRYIKRISNPEFSWQDFCYIPPQCLYSQIIQSFQQKIYSIGILLYRLIYKTLPFICDDTQVSIHIKQVQSVRFPKYLKFLTSNSLKQFIKKCTSSDVLERFKNIEEVYNHEWYSNNLQ